MRLYVVNCRVVTGLRFVKKNRIIHVQIQEGKLLPMGLIDKDSVQWVAVDDMRVTDRNAIHDIDYLTLSWERRALDLDDLQGDHGQVVIGMCEGTRSTILFRKLSLQESDLKSWVRTLISRSWWHRSTSKLES